LLLWNKIYFREDSPLVAEVVDNTTSTPKQSEKLYTYVGESAEKKFVAYQNNYCLNIGYCVNSDVLDWNYDYPDPFAVQNDYFEKATGIDTLFTQVQIDDFLYDGVDEIPMGYDTGEINYTCVNPEDSSLTAVYNIDESKDYYLYLDFGDFENVTIEYDDVAYSHDFDSEHMVGIGHIEAGTTLTVQMPFESDAPTSGEIKLLLCSMDMEKFEKGYKILKNGELNVTTFTDTDIQGTVHASEDCLFYTSIPYDEGWQVTVDGKRVSVETLRECKIGNGLLGFNLTKGEHTVEMKYVPRGLIVGVAISAATIVILFALLVLLRKNKFVSALIGGYSDETNHIYEVIVFEELPCEDIIETNSLCEGTPNVDAPSTDTSVEDEAQPEAEQS